MADVVDLGRNVLIAAPYDQAVTASVKVESLPVWFDLGWQKVAGQDYTPFEDVEPLPAAVSQSVEEKSVAPVIAALHDAE